MKNKIFSLFALSVFALVLLVSGVSAAITLSPTSYSVSIGQGSSGSFTFTIFNDGGTGNQAVQNITAIPSNLISGSNTLQSSQVSVASIPSSVAPNSTSSAITVTISVPSTQATGVYNGTITVGGVHNDTLAPVASKTISLSITVTSNLPPEIITSNAVGSDGLQVKKITFSNNGLSSGVTFGEDGTWFPFENIDAEIQIKNTNSDARVNNIKVEWGLWDTNAHQWVIEMNDEKEFDLKHGDTKTLTVPFSINNKMDVDLSDMTDGSHYKFYVTATGEADDTNSTPVSANLDKDTTVNLESDFVILDNFQVPSAAQCGKTVTLTADVWNMDGDQDNVSVNVYNKDLGINQKVVVGDINSFDRVSLNFDLKVPSGADEKSYPIQFTVYDEDNQLYQDSNDDEAVFTAPLTVQGSCVYATASTTNVNVELSSGGNAGQPMTLTATVTNTGDKTADYTFNLNGYASWAKLGDISPANLTLAPGDSQEVVITLNVNKDASGQKAFSFDTYSNGNLVTKQPLTATIASGFSLASITGDAVGSSAPLIIGLLSVILVVVIIIILVKVSKK